MPDAKTALTVFDAYNYLRDEIKREDEITHQRLIVALTFHGFLIAAMTFLLSNQWTFDSATMMGPQGFYRDLQAIRIAVLYGIGAAGVTVGIGTVAGIHAARQSIKATLDWWQTKIIAKSGNVTITGTEDCPPMIPPVFAKSHDRMNWLGGASAMVIAYAFPILWGLYLLMMACKSFG